MRDILRQERFKKKAITGVKKQKALRPGLSERPRKRLCLSLPEIEKSSRLWPAVEFMGAHYDLQIRLKELALLTRLNVFHFAHLFRQETGIAPIEYLTRLRMHHAKRLLVTTDWNYSDVMEATGYNHQSYFIRMFRRFTGMTPGQFRLRKKQN